MSLKDFAKKHNIKQFMMSFTDLCGIMRSKLVPASAIEAMEKSGAGFAGFATYLDMSPADADMFAMPDARAAITLPWKPEVAWVPCNLVINGEPLEQCPRNTLNRTIEKAKKQGYQLKTGVECEFFLLDKESHVLADSADNRAKPCYDSGVLHRHYDIINRISEAMQQLGWGPYQADHEDANGQFEMNWDYDDALVTADRHAFFKFMVQCFAEEAGMRATFMPKPFSHLTGNGCHMHFSLWDKKGNNVFHDASGELGLSPLAYHFLGGVMNHAPALTAFANPTVNSYKRIHAASTASGASWSPNVISYTGNNRTHMVRIPDNDRFELRLADGATNPYLLPASVLAAGLHGMEQEGDPGLRRDNNAYASPTEGAELLPRTLLESLDHLAECNTLRDQLGARAVEAYYKTKQEEWSEYMGHVSEWETQYYA